MKLFHDNFTLLFSQTTAYFLSGFEINSTCAFWGGLISLYLALCTQRPSHMYVCVFVSVCALLWQFPLKSRPLTDGHVPCSPPAALSQWIYIKQQRGRACLSLHPCCTCRLSSCPAACLPASPPIRCPSGPSAHFISFPSSHIFLFSSCSYSSV